MQAKKTWVLVADGARARILRGLNFLGEKIDDEAEISFVAEHLRAADYWADKPGRSHASANSRRSAMEMTSDPVRQAEQDFATMLINELETYHEASAFDRLALIAAPQMLGDLRAALPASLKEMVVAEVVKDLTKMTAPDLQATVTKLLQEHQTL